jgi:hypothetical protein
MKPLVFDTEAEMVDAIRQRVDELNISRARVDQLCGLADGHTAKLLCPARVKRFGSTSLPLVLQALALRIVRVEIAEDPEAAAKMRQRWTPRKRPPVPSRRKPPAQRCVAEPGKQEDLFCSNTEQPHGEE